MFSLSLHSEQWAPPAMECGVLLIISDILFCDVINCGRVVNISADDIGSTDQRRVIGRNNATVGSISRLLWNF